ncbi:ABC transporter ATP-binding protein [Corynebacterium tuberculostearicum]|uniref:ABC transporter ATP-binding protein n=1 Tax=Corynebacterium tuberculostearicum TaxID=38304 RepID=UPI00254FB2E6|nr:ABC transporter ATP-binding protein [Corynebacterium tuberculostearicum]MDK8676201.1 ABC transporter ATP-binding protein [Corynebacterium tuberculostearicum]
MNSPHVILRGVKREFADNTGLHETDLSINRGEFISILGPSGCGKSTLLRCIAGLETPNAGTIAIGEREVYGPRTNVAVNKRRLSMVFQDLALWPHMTVEKNIEFPLTTPGNKVAAGQRSEKVRACMDMVGITSKAKARPNQLSGGQQQRVAIARALVSNPDLLLMDEPLSALDAALRVQIRAELTQLAQELGLTVIYVTHDQAEALAMSDRVVVMNQGHIEQFADPVTLYEQPATDFIAGFVGTMNRHPQLPSVRPENLTVTTAEEDTGASPRRVEAQVLGAHYIGGRYELRCDVPGAEEPWVTYSPHRFTRGETVYLNYPSSLSA